jgi:predicted O-methyltransferase YrrM
MQKSKVHTYNEIREIVYKIDGWLTEKEGKFLYEAAQNYKGIGVIVEIGSFKGKSTVCLALGSKSGNNVPVYAIDSYPEEFGGKSTFEEFKLNIKRAGVEDIVNTLYKTSEEANKKWNMPIELLWIDGDHTFEMVKLDYEVWMPYLIDGGIIAFHDAIQGGPKKVICKFVLKSNKFKNCGLKDSIFYAIKSNNLSLKDKLRNNVISFFLNMYEIAYGINRLKYFKKLIKRILGI